jgi:D-alanyl-lipoteichoic acid acyltransferase DltB (MBOAT superfamily)
MLEASNQQARRPANRPVRIPRDIGRAVSAFACIVFIGLSAFSTRLGQITGLEWPPLWQLRPEFNSFGFMLIFLPCVLVLYVLYRGSRAANWILGLASLVVYATTGLIYLLPLLLTCALDFAIGRYLARSSDEGRRKIALVASIAVQLLLLCTFKYAAWLWSELGKLSSLLGLGIAFPQIFLPLPPGISFYTFHTISYTVDTYRRRFTPRASLIDYITFVAFFPQLIAGPIARASELLPQIAVQRPSVSDEQIEEAFWLIAWGLFKKICLADNFGLIVTQAAAALHNSSQPANGAGYLFMYGFAAQIYCDFSAYTDIARGIGKLFGLQLPRNFLTPYLANSPSDFWQRWHISLSRWLRDYLYIPLGGDHYGRLRTLLNLAVTMFLGGLWHGAGIGFIVWGLYHGLLLILYRLVPIDHLLPKKFGSVGTTISMLLMFNLVCVGWIFFRAPANEIFPLLSSLTTLPSMDPATSTAKGWQNLALLGLPLLITEILAYCRGVEFVDLYRSMPRWLRPFSYVAMFYVGLFIAPSETDRFIYFQF